MMPLLRSGFKRLAGTGPGVRIALAAGTVQILCGKFSLAGKHMAEHLDSADLAAGLAGILAAPKDVGRLDMIVTRPETDAREVLESCRITLAGGVPGDHWNLRSHVMTEDGKPHPDTQICIMMSRCIGLIAGEKENWPPAGDNLFIDMDMTPDNMAPGQKFSIGTAVLQVTEIPHNGCDKFIARYGRDAAVFVNTGEGKRLRLRGIYARVVQDGVISAGDSVIKSD